MLKTFTFKFSLKNFNPNILFFDSLQIDKLDFEIGYPNKIYNDTKIHMQYNDVRFSFSFQLFPIK